MRILTFSLFAIVVASCGGELGVVDPAPNPASDDAGDDAAGATSDDSSGNSGGSSGSGGTTGGCNVVAEDYTDLPQAYHVPTCSPLTYVSNPPCYGDHYPVWAAYKAYDAVVPRGFWIHDMEHGGVVISYNCPDGCADEVAAAKQMLDDQPQDPLCDPTEVVHRLVLLPDPLLNSRFAASAWGHLIRSDCFDRATFEAFVKTHYDHGTEELCAQGEDVIADGLDPSCGQSQ